MCGIAGIFGHLSADAPTREAHARAMTHSLERRGPDADGFFFDHKNGVALGHRRLAIVDLSNSGAQPMTSQSGRYVIAYNGEIYNTVALRTALDKTGAPEWRGTSDTEVLLQLIETHGLVHALSLLDGMFAFALFDRQTDELTLVRDPFGEKPLCYGVHNGELVFASQFDALECLPEFKPALNPSALAYYFEYSYIPAPLSIYDGFYKLEPGHLLTIKADRLEGVSPENTVTYWDPVVAAQNAQNAPFTGDYKTAVTQTEQLLKTSVEGRLMSDVPLGCLLSGGIDSSLVAAMMTETGGGRPKTFCIGMAQDGFDESHYAKQVAEHLDTDHTELMLTPADLLDVIPHMSDVYDEPFSDSSQIAMLIVSRLARGQVTVALSGDAGDELMGGYNRYIHGPNLWQRLDKIPGPLRRVTGRALNALPMNVLDPLLSGLGRLAGRNLGAGQGAEKVKKLAGLLGCVDEAALHKRLLTTSLDGATALKEGPQITALSLSRDDEMGQMSFMQRMIVNDVLNYLPGDILTKVDRAAMFESLETRTPFLNRSLYDFAWSLPDEMRVAQGQGKRILRDILYKYVPQQLVDRPKAGFAVPVGRWLRDELRDWAEEMLSETALARSAMLDVGLIRTRWQEHVSGRRNHEHFLWSVLMFQGWCERRGR